MFCISGNTMFKVASSLINPWADGWWNFTLVLFSLLAQFPTTEFETFISQRNNKKQHSGQKCHHIQREVLDPVEVLNCTSEVFGSFMPHHKFCPEDGEVEWVDRTVFVNNRESLHGFLVSGQSGGHRNTSEKRQNEGVSIERLPTSLPSSPGAINDIIQSLQEHLCCNWSQIQDDANTFTCHLLRIVRLISGNRNHHHGNSVTYALIETMWSSMSDESPHSRMS